MQPHERAALVAHVQVVTLRKEDGVGVGRARRSSSRNAPQGWLRRRLVPSSEYTSHAALEQSVLSAWRNSAISSSVLSCEPCLRRISESMGAMPTFHGHKCAGRVEKRAHSSRPCAINSSF